ncbi:MAG: T9SS type A sorting domain-containing protein, partial [Bacteroidota bacterium]
VTNSDYLALYQYTLGTCADISLDAPIVAAVNYCEGSTAVALTAMGENLQWYEASTGGTTIATPTPNTDVVGTTSYWVSQTVEGCESARSQITVTVNAIPNAPSVANVSYCVGETASALTATGSNLAWYDTSSGGTSISTPTPNTAAAGTTNYWVSQTVEGCESSRAQITVTINAIPNAPTVTNVSYCVGETASTLTATGSNLTWYDVSSGGTSIGTPTPNTAAAGTTDYWVSQTVSGCESSRSQITVTINAIPDAPLVTNVNYCVGETASALMATGSNLIWYDMSSGGTSISTPTPNTAAAGTTNYWVSQTVEGCESSRSQITVTINAIPDAPSVTNVSYCVGETASALTAMGSNLTWYDVSNGGTSISTPTPSTDAAGTTNYWVSQTVNSCEGSRSQITVTVNAIPDAPSVTNVSYCVGETASVLTATGSNLTWYDMSSGGTSISTPTPNTNAAGTTNYWVSQTVEGCESSRSQITVTVNAIPDAPSVTNVSYCVGETASALTATGSNLTWYDMSSGGTSISTPTPNTAAAGTTNYWVSQTVDGCESTRSQITVTVNAIPDMPSVSNISYCVGETASALTATGSNLIWYDMSSGGTSINTPTPSTDAAGTTNYWVSQTVDGCESIRSQITVTVNAIPDAPSVTNVSYCVGETASALTATGSNLTWYDASSGGTAIDAPTPNTSTVGATSYWVSQMVSGCESKRAKTEVIVREINNTVMDFVLVATEDIEALDLTHLLFYADADLESDAQITEAATKDVSFHAGQQITLTAGFTVSAGNTFTAKIGAPCKDESAITENRIATSRTTQSKTAFDLFDCQVYPNPTQNWAHIKITQSRTRQVQLSLFDANGRLLQTLLQEASLASGQHTYQLDLQNVEEGIYWLRLMGDREIITKKVVVLRQ